MSRRKVRGIVLLLLLAGAPAGARADDESLEVSPGVEVAREWRATPAPCVPDTLSGCFQSTWLDSEPFGARVVVGDTFLGTTPLWIEPGVLAGRPLRLSLPGYRTQVVDGVRTEDVLVVRLESDETRGSGEWRGGRSFFQRRSVRYGLLLLGAGAAALGVRYKERSDEAYDEYLRTGNRAKMRDAFDRAKKYDRCALGCWAAAEASAVLFMYLLATSGEAEDGPLEVGLPGESGGPSLGVRWRF